MGNVRRMGVDIMIDWEKEDVDEFVRHCLSFVLRLSLVLGGLGFASVFAIAVSSPDFRLSLSRGEGGGLLKRASAADFV